VKLKNGAPSFQAAGSTSTVLISRRMPTPCGPRIRVRPRRGGWPPAHLPTSRRMPVGAWVFGLGPRGRSAECAGDAAYGRAGCGRRLCTGKLAGRIRGVRSANRALARQHLQQRAGAASGQRELGPACHAGARTHRDQGPTVQPKAAAGRVGFGGRQSRGPPMSADGVAAPCCPTWARHIPRPRLMLPQR